MSNLVIGDIESNLTKNKIPLELPVENVSLLNIYSGLNEEESKNSVIEHWLVDWLIKNPGSSLIERFGLSIRDDFPALSLLRKNQEVNDWSGIAEARIGLKAIMSDIFYRRKLFGEEGVGSFNDYNLSAAKKIKRKLVLIPSAKELFKIAKDAQVVEYIQEILHDSAAYGYSFLITSPDLRADEGKFILEPEIKIIIKKNNIIFKKIHTLLDKAVNNKKNNLLVNFNYGSRSLSMLNVQEYMKKQEESKKKESNDFFSVKIGKNGAKDFYLNIGETSEIIHGFISGTTGSGKSTFIKKIVLEAIKKYMPDQLNIDLIDLKQSVDSDVFIRNPCRVISGTLGVKPTFEEINSLFDYYLEMIEDRYEKIKSAQCKNISTFNMKNQGIFKMPYKVVIIDEAHEIFKRTESMMNNYRLSERIQLLLQKSRAAGIHFLFASQSFRNSGFTDTTKEQMQLRLALKAGSSLESMGMIGDESAFKIENSPSDGQFYLIHNSQCGNPDANSLILLDCLRDDEIETELKHFQDQTYRVPVISFVENDHYLEDDDSSPALPSLEDMDDEEAKIKQAQAIKFQEIMRLKLEIDRNRSSQE